MHQVGGHRQAGDAESHRCIGEAASGLGGDVWAEGWHHLQSEATESVISVLGGRIHCHGQKKSR